MRTLLLVFLLLPASLWAESPASAEFWQRSDLERQLDQDEVKIIAAGESEFLTLQLPAMTAEVKGTALLIPDGSQHPASPRYIQTLRQQLIDYGWNTIAILPPEAAADDSTEALEQYQQLLLQRVVAATTAARQNSGYLIVLAQGNNGALVAQLYADKKIPEPESLVLLSAYHPLQAGNKQLAQWIAKLAIPTLDLKQQKDNSVLDGHWRLRQQWVNKENKLLYRQRELPGDMKSPLWQEQMLKEVYGWLSYQGY
ncbi:MULTISPECIES: DUF3530 family protein [Rheinheimera]|uniref:DUF3530 family protein n=1 Tax=Rheinheimera marina TaxID=1774958 RepID=A0ABV9JPB1_9GAMM